MFIDGKANGFSGLQILIVYFGGLQITPKRKGMRITPKRRYRRNKETI